MSHINLQIKPADVNHSALNTWNTRRTLKAALYALTALVYAFLSWNALVFVGGVL